MGNPLRCETKWEFLTLWLWYLPVQFSSVTQLCPSLCDPMNCSMPGFPVHHQLPELAQSHVHQVSDAIQPSHPLLSPSPPAFNLSQQQGKGYLPLQHELFQGARDQGCGIKMGVESSFSSHLVLFSGEWRHLPEEYDMSKIQATLCVCVCVLVAPLCLFETPWSMEFSRQRVVEWVALLLGINIHRVLFPISLRKMCAPSSLSEAVMETK